MSAPPAPITELHICPSCRGELVYPVSWDVRKSGWLIELRCPECEWRLVGVFHHSVCARLCAVLNKGDIALRSTLELMVRERLQDSKSKHLEKLGLGLEQGED